MHRILGALLALILLLTACGSAESSFRDQLNELGFTDETADCLITELDDRGLGVEDITDDAIADGMPAGAEEAIEACLTELADDVAREVDDPPNPNDQPIDTGVPGDTPPIDPPIDPPTDTDETSDVGADYGDDPELDALWDACAGGDGNACDELYFSSPFDTEYERFADTCGDTAPPGGICGDGSAGFDLGGADDAHDYGDDSELDALWDACAAGDGDSCDELYFISPIGSVYEEFGNTCGGAVPEGAVLCANEI